MTDLKDTLRRDLTSAMKAQRTFDTQTLRLVLAAIAKEEVAGASARQLSLAEEQAVLRRESRQRREAAEIYAGAGRAELADKERAEAELIDRYLPAPLSPEELDAIVAAVLAGHPDATLKQMGLIVKAVNAEVQGRAEGALVAQKVKAALAGS
ncbi:MAG: GatB/YqeY domain-containing protein [Propionibacteriaceae bacterium]|nr:GatB/YqeY domain-containing protein [Propionibacteriaceae bacterium]